MSEFLPFALPFLGEEEILEVSDTLRSGWLTTGPKTAQFEKDFCDFIGSSYSLAVNSATSGLHLALEAVGVGEGDRVITTAYTFTATTEVIRYLGADPILVDIDPKTFNIDPDEIRKIANQYDNIKAILPVHFAGQSCDMDKIKAIATEYDWKIVEDAAHALPTTYNGKMIGTLADITVFSFYVTKTIATGEGGMIVSDNEEYIKQMKVMRLHGINHDVFDRYTSDKPSWFYEIVEPGYKYNMSDISASLGIHQLKKAHSFHKRRKWIAEQYNQAFADMPIETPYIAKPDDTHAWYLYVIQLDFDSLSIDRNDFIELMLDEGIGTSVHFIPLHLHPYWRQQYDYLPEDYPISLSVYKRAVSLPIYPKMTNNDVLRVTKAVRKILLNHSVCCLRKA